MASVEWTDAQRQLNRGRRVADRVPMSIINELRYESEARAFAETGDLALLRELLALALLGNEEPPNEWSECVAEAARPGTAIICPMSVRSGLYSLGAENIPGPAPQCLRVVFDVTPATAQ